MKTILDQLNLREFGVFNSREVAIFICVLVLLLFLSFSKKLRISILNVAKALFAKNLSVMYLLALLYSLIPVYVLYALGFWKTSLYKDFVFWSLFSAFPVLMSVNKADKKFFMKAFTENIQFSVITDFITSQHTFNIFIEIMLVIFIVFIASLLAFSSREERHKDVYNVCNIILVFIGFYMFLSSCYYLLKDINGFLSVEKFQEFSLPIILGVWFIPFLYGLHVYMTYETVFSSMKYSIDEKSIRHYAKKRALISFNFNLDMLKRWKDSLFIQAVKTKEDLLISILDIKRLELVERNPPKVDPSKGWSPYEAKDFLLQNGIATNHYKKAYDDEWLATSTYVPTDSEIFGNNISYYVLGDNSVAKKLKLVLNVNLPDSDDSAVTIFLDHVSSLYRKALSEELPIIIGKSIRKRQNKTIKNLNKKVSICKTEYVNKSGGYMLTFVIEHE